MRKFNILKLVLWYKNGNKRILNFHADRVNVITGNSNTGKTAILDIIDYCFFSSSKNISDSVINESVLWYGIVFEINDKTYTLARKHYMKEVSKDYYFSSVGEIPDSFPIPNNTEKELKTIIETEFTINSNLQIPYGGHYLKQNSKISLRFFLMFNTISQNLITESRNIYFDKQHKPRYQEALPRIFDIATGIETIENILNKEEKEKLEKRIKRFENSGFKVQNDDMLKELILKAREMNLVSSGKNLDEAILELGELIKRGKITENTDISKRENLEKERNLINRKIKNLRAFKNRYNDYKKNLFDIHDSLKPIEYLKNNVEVRTAYFSELIQSLEGQLYQLKDTNKNNTPIDRQVDDQLEKLKTELRNIQSELNYLPKDQSITESDADKLMFIGGAKVIWKMNYNSSKDSEKLQNKIDELKEKVNSISIENTIEKKSSTIGLVEEIIRGYLVKYGSVLGNYADYQPQFDYKNKALQLRKPNSIDIEPSVGSSSNHMFLHLFFSLAIHEVIFLNKSPYVLPFLIIDQPSRPYYGGDNQNRKTDNMESDDEKIKQAFRLLNDYVDNRLARGGHFQMIVFEHVSPSFFEELKYFNLVEEFKDGNALIRDI